MTENAQKHHDCSPNLGPADQPANPPGDAEECKLPDPESNVPEPACKKCPKPPCKCNCPEEPPSGENCLEKLIDKQDVDILEAEKAKEFKTEITALLTKAEAATEKYTQATYDDLVKDWKTQDDAIVTAIHSLVCTVPCWECVLECYVCPLIYNLRYTEKLLINDNKRYDVVYDLYDLQYWHTRDRDAKERTYLRIKSVLAAWEKPADTIRKVLTDVDDILKKVPTLPAGTAIYELLLRAVPMHLAIAPPATSPQTTTNIDKKYTNFCTCKKDEPKEGEEGEVNLRQQQAANQGGEYNATARKADSDKAEEEEPECDCCKEPTPDTCCGPNVGERALRERLIDPLPYLIAPRDYFTVICCLAQHRYLPAKERLSEAIGKLANVETRIARDKAKVADGIKNFADKAKAVLPASIDCTKYTEKPKPKEEPTQDQQNQQTEVN